MIRRAMLLIGSGKASGASTSESLGRYLCDQLAARGVGITVHRVPRSPSSHEEERLLADLADADLFVLASPVYIDSLPCLVTRTLERISAARVDPRPCALVAIVNSGFPESQQCATALAIARTFARRAHFEWAGGLALGGGGSIDGRPLEQLGGMVRSLREALKESAAALALGQPVPKAVQDRFARPLLPAALYTTFGNIGWYRRAMRNHALTHLGDRPYNIGSDGDAE